MIVRYSPLERFSEIDKLFDSFLGGDRVVTAWAPRVDAKETEKELTFHVELPGMKEEDINVEFDGSTLSISGKREFSSDETKENYVRIERRYGSFERTFTVSAAIKREEISANYRDGVLTVVLPKANGSGAHRIAITSGNSN